MLRSRGAHSGTAGADDYRKKFHCLSAASSVVHSCHTRCVAVPLTPLCCTARRPRPCRALDMHGRWCRVRTLQTSGGMCHRPSLEVPAPRRPDITWGGSASPAAMDQQAGAQKNLATRSPSETRVCKYYMFCKSRSQLTAYTFSEDALRDTCVLFRAGRIFTECTCDPVLLRAAGRPNADNVDPLDVDDVVRPAMDSIIRVRTGAQGRAASKPFRPQTACETPSSPSMMRVLKHRHSGLTRL